MALTKVDAQLVGGAITTDSSGNVGIGTASPSAKLDVLRSGDGTAVKWGNGTTSGSLFTSATQVALLDGGTLSNGLGIVPATNYVYLATAGTERMCVTSDGNLLVGTTPAAGNTARGVFARASATSYYDGQLSLIATNSSNVLLGLGTPDNGVCLRKENGVNSIDAVNSNQTAWTNFRASAFSVQSDYRVKENIAPINNALDRVSQLNPVRFNYAQGSMAYTDGKLVDGFIAHEVAEVVPEAVIGAKDEVKEDGTPLYQSLDQAKLIPILAKAIQELKAELDATKAQLDESNLILTSVKTEVAALKAGA